MGFLVRYKKPEKPRKMGLNIGLVWKLGGFNGWWWDFIGFLDWDWDFISWWFIGDLIGFNGDVTTKYGDFMKLTMICNWGASPDRINWDLIGIHCWDLMEINSDNGI